MFYDSEIDKKDNERGFVPLFGDLNWCINLNSEWS